MNAGTICKMLPTRLLDAGLALFPDNLDLLSWHLSRASHQEHNDLRHSHVIQKPPTRPTHPYMPRHLTPRPFMLTSPEVTPRLGRSFLWIWPAPHSFCHLGLPLQQTWTTPARRILRTTPALISHQIIRPFWRNRLERSVDSSESPYLMTPGQSAKLLGHRPSRSPLKPFASGHWYQVAHSGLPTLPTPQISSGCINGIDDAR